MPIHIPPCTSENASNGGCTSDGLGTLTPKREQSSSVACPVEMKKQSQSLNNLSIVSRPTSHLQQDFSNKFRK